MNSVRAHVPSRRDFLKGLGLLALSALPACRRAQEYATAPDECPEWMRAGEATCFATSLPRATGALPLLAVCHGGLPTSLQPNPHYPHRRGLPAAAQAAILDLYDPGRIRTPTLHGTALPWEGLRGALRAWARALRAGRRAAFLFPEGYDAVRQLQMQELATSCPGVRFYRYDPLAEPRPPVFPQLAALQEESLGSACRFETGAGRVEELMSALPEFEFLFLLTPADAAALRPDLAHALETTSAETVRLTLRPDVTSSLCSCTIPLTHFLEEWGAEADAHGQLCLRQPVTFPLRAALSEAEFLHALLNDGEIPPETRRELSTDYQWLTRVIGSPEEHLRRGFVPSSAPLPHPLPSADEATPYLHPFFVDGRFLHNAWLRETPDPLSGCAGLPSVFLPGREHGNRRVKLGRYTLPAQVVPGLTRPLRPLLPGVDARTPLRLLPEDVSDERTAAPLLRPLRPLPPESAAPFPAPPAGSTSPRWGLLIDLSVCIGCSACVLACRAENNIPTVGEEELRRGRDLQWLRLERYFTPGTPHLRFVPAACRHCAQAPCEAVCPVHATVRTGEGLNAMVYPRCWGTRYCAAACPYGARSFNFHDYARRAAHELPLPPNPRVTVRSRGVMEKCTLCVQRLHGITPGSRAPQTACEAACPAGAIRLVDLAKTPLPSRINTSFDVPGTMPGTFYLG